MTASDVSIYVDHSVVSSKKISWTLPKMNTILTSSEDFDQDSHFGVNRLEEVTSISVSIQKQGSYSFQLFKIPLLSMTFFMTFQVFHAHRFSCYAKNFLTFSLF